MHRPFAAFLVFLLTLTLIVPVAWAGGRVVGEGYVVSVGSRFERLDARERSSSPATQLPLTKGLSVRGDPELHLFYAGRPAHPYATVVISRIELTDPGQVRSRLDLQRYVLDHVRQSPQELEALVAEGNVEVKPYRVGGLEGLTMRHEGSPGALGLIGEPATRALVVRGRDYLLVVALMVLNENHIPVEETWQHILRSLKLEAHSAMAKSLFLYGSIGLAALILLVFVMRLRAQRRARAPAWMPPPRITVTSCDDMVDDDLARDEMAEPDLHPAGGPPPAEPVPSGPDGVGTSLPVEEREPREAPGGGLTPALAKHRSEHPEAPVAPAPAPLVSEELDDATLPPPEPRPEFGAVPPSDLEHQQEVPKRPPKRKGLIRTRPEGGRFSE
ncbi:MAG: hypothetical protein QNJ90_04305 [Planctomycetota bacterium]|nr:hypothetical protein [Planctomycetota bacterium]